MASTLPIKSSPKPKHGGKFQGRVDSVLRVGTGQGGTWKGEQMEATLGPHLTTAYNRQQNSPRTYEGLAWELCESCHMLGRNLASPHFYCMLQNSPWSRQCWMENPGTFIQNASLPCLQFWQLYPWNHICRGCFLIPTVGVWSPFI